MKKLLIILAIVCITGCKKPFVVEQPKRLTVKEEYGTSDWGPYLYIVQDNNNNQEYLIAKYGGAIAICPITKQEIQVEKN